MCEKGTVLWLTIGGCENYEENGGVESVMSSVMSTTQVIRKTFATRLQFSLYTFKSSLIGL